MLASAISLRLGLGATFVTSGIWREVRLQGWTDVRINDLFIRQNEVNATSAQVTAVVEVETSQPIDTVIRIGADGQRWEKAISLQAGSHTVEVPSRFRIQALVEPWIG